MREGEEGKTIQLLAYYNAIYFAGIEWNILCLSTNLKKQLKMGKP